MVSQNSTTAQTVRIGPLGACCCFPRVLNIRPFHPEVNWWSSYHLPKEKMGNALSIYLGQRKPMRNFGVSDVPVVPPELISQIVSHCALSTLLQLRLVSKSVQALVDSSTRLEELLQDVQIQLCCLTLEEFVEKAPRSLRLSNFHIKLSSPSVTDDRPVRLWDSTPDFYRDTPQLRKFLESFGPGIRKLCVSRMFCGTVDEELKFFRGLPNLRDLEIKLLSPLSTEDHEDEEFQVKSQRLPVIQKTLMRLVVDMEMYSGEYLVQWIQSCPSLEDIKLPNSWSMRNGMDGEVGSAIECHPHILRLGVQGHLQHLRHLDLNFMNVRINKCSREDLRFLQELAANEKVLLENVPNSFVQKLTLKVPLETFEDFKNRIASFDGPSDLLKEDGFVNLVQLSFDLPFGIPNSVNWTVDSLPVRLPALQKISGSWSIGSAQSGPKILHFLQCVFHPNEPRAKVSELGLGVKRTSSYDGNDGLAERPSISLPSHMETTFPNLTKLAVTLEYLNQRELSQAMEVITRNQLLEELSLYASWGVPQDAFSQSKSEEGAVLLRLKNLKKLRLVALDTDNLVGDRLLRLLSMMNLTHLHIACQIPGIFLTVTSKGINALGEGPLGQSILWAELKPLEGRWKQKSLSRLDKICHRNRVAAGLTSTTSFKEFQLSAKAFAGSGRSFRGGEWTGSTFLSNYLHRTIFTPMFPTFSEMDI